MEVKRQKLGVPGVGADLSGEDFRIRQLRAHTGLTLEQLAQRSGVSRAMLSKVERGEKSPTLPVIVRIAGGFNMSLSSFLGAEPDPSDVAIIRAAKRLTFKDPETGFERAVLSPDLAGLLRHAPVGLQVLLGEGQHISIDVSHANSPYLGWISLSS